MVATGNVGLAFGLTCAAGLATSIGACIIFCAKLTNAKFLAGSLGFSAGVMLCMLYCLASCVVCWYGLRREHSYVLDTSLICNLGIIHGWAPLCECLTMWYVAFCRH